MDIYGYLWHCSSRERYGHKILIKWSMTILGDWPILSFWWANPMALKMTKWRCQSDPTETEKKTQTAQDGPSTGVTGRLRLVHKHDAILYVNSQVPAKIFCFQVLETNMGKQEQTTSNHLSVAKTCTLIQCRSIHCRPSSLAPPPAPLHWCSFGFSRACHTKS